MSPARFAAVYRLDLGRLLRRPMLWTLALIVAFAAWGLSTGSVRISSGAAIVGGRQAWITSELSVALALAMLVALLYAFFASITAGRSISGDDELGVAELLHVTPLAAGEYVWGKASALLTAFLAVLGVQLAAMVAFNHLVPNPEAAEIHGPFSPLNYLRPALVFAVPTLLFFIGVAFWLGERWRRAGAAFLFPVAVVAVCGSFLWNWSPSWLPPAVNRLLMLIDPGGVRWLSETWLKVDRGADFYNAAQLAVDPAFALSRLVFAGLGIAAVAATHRHLARSVRRGGAAAGRRRRSAAGGAEAVPAAAVPAGRLADRRTPPVWWLALGRVAGAEVSGLLRHPGLYFFAFFVVSQTLAQSLLISGAFGTRVLLTPGLIAGHGYNTVALMLCLLLMYFLVESLERERTTGTVPLVHSAPIPTAALLGGKILGNGAIAAGVLTAVYLGAAIAIVVQGRVAPSPGPFLLFWGLVLLPTLAVWCAFVTAVYALTGSRFTSYGLCLGVVILTVYQQLTDGMSWVGNWLAWGLVRWSDISLLELDRWPLLLNRLLAITLAALLFVVAVGAFGRRRRDPSRLLDRLRPRPLARGALRLAPWLVVPLAAGVVLWLAVLDGRGGEAAERLAGDYWQQNRETWRDAPQPSLAGVEVELDLEPAQSRLASRGSLRLVNRQDQPLERFALTGGRHWRDVAWTLDGGSWEPEERSGLYVFAPPEPLAPGDAVEVGFDFHGRYPDGISRNGGGTMTFVLPSAVVLSGMDTSFVPQVGYDEDRGVDDDNRTDPPDYPDDLHLAVVPPEIGAERPFATRIAVTVPEDMTVNSVGVLESDTVAAGRRTAVWVSDHGVRIFNVVAGRWAVRRGEGTAIYYHPGHEFNLERMASTLDGARRFYSEWFYPYPWRELKLSEFAGLADYAQGFPTNITFSESIGFLTRPEEDSDVVMFVTAHEAAHQWWANLLTPGDGPGAGTLSEGMANFSTLLLVEELAGAEARRQLARQIENRYGESRRADGERPLVATDGSQPGDTTVIYDKSGWVMWMLMRQMGREPLLAGLHRFIAEYENGPDFPLVADLLDTLRPFAADAEAFDRFAATWFRDVAVPRYRLTGAVSETVAGGWRTTATLHHEGSGRFPVAVAAVAGERAAAGEASAGWRQAGVTVAPAPGEGLAIEIVSDFPPERLVVDPDVELLMLAREAASAEL